MATPSSQIAAELWPQILRRLERWQRNVGTGGGSGGTVTVEFTGTVTDEQAPQFILRDGSRSLQGNLAVDTGVTIDGVDISAHAADSSAHHAPVTAGDGIGVTGQSVAVNSTVVRTTRTVSAGDGLSGGGDLSANRSFAVNSTVVRTTRTLTAGDGLSGGGDLSANRSFAVDSTVVRTTRTLSAGTGITGGGDLSANRSFAVNQAFTPTWTGVHTFNAQPTIAANLSFSGARSVTSTSSNDLTLAPGGELVLDPGDTVTMAAGHEFRSATFSDLVTGIAGFRAWDRGSNAYQLTIGGLKADELYARVFVADETRIDRGEEFWSKSYGIVETAFALPAIDALFNVWFEDAPALASANLFSTGDWLMFRTVDWSTGLVLSTVWCEVAYKNLPGTDRQQWALYRRSGGATGQTIKAGSTALNMGQSGQGWVHLSALNSAGGPFVQVGTWAGANPYTPANVTNRVRMGHLSGAAGFGSGDYGFAAGNDLGLTPATGFQGFTAEATDGAALYNTDVEMFDGGVLKTKLSMSTGLAITASDSLLGDAPSSISWYNDDLGGDLVGYLSNYWDGMAQYMGLKVTHPTAPIYMEIGADATTLVIDDTNDRFTFNGSDLFLTDGIVRVNNTDDTAGAILQLTESHTRTGLDAGIRVHQNNSSGDAKIAFSVNNTLAAPTYVYNIGIDNTDDRFKMSHNASGELQTDTFLQHDVSSGILLDDKIGSTVGINVAPSTDAQLDVVSGAAGRHALRLKAAASPTVATLSIDDSSGTEHWGVSPTGVRLAWPGLTVQTEYSMAAGEVYDTGRSVGILLLLSSSSGRGAIYVVDSFGAQAVFSVAGYSDTKDTSNSINVYRESSTVRIQNTWGTPRSVRMFFFGA